MCLDKQVVNEDVDGKRGRNGTMRTKRRENEIKRRKITVQTPGTYTGAVLNDLSTGPGKLGEEEPLVADKSSGAADRAIVQLIPAYLLRFGLSSDG